MTTLKSALSLCGLSHSEAAEYLSDHLGRTITKNTVDDMARGKTRAGLDIFAALSDLFLRIEEAAEFAADNIEPDLISPIHLQNLDADNGDDPLPANTASIAGALALLIAIEGRNS